MQLKVEELNKKSSATNGQRTKITSDKLPTRMLFGQSSDINRQESNMELRAHSCFSIKKIMGNIDHSIALPKTGEGKARDSPGSTGTPMGISFFWISRGISFICPISYTATTLQIDLDINNARCT